MIITRNMPMWQAVLGNHQLLPLLTRFDIQLGFGERSVEEVCNDHRVNIDFFLEIANAYLDEEYVPGEGLSRFSIGTVVQYLNSTHDYYVRTALPQVEEKIRRMLDQSSLSHKEVKLVTDFFNDYKSDFLSHISEEEDRVLPYILDLEEQSSRENQDPQFIEKLRNYTIGSYEQEHDRLETSLENLSSLIIKYLPPIEDFRLCYQVLNDLASLVKDLIDHANMEDKVLFPRVSALEKQLLSKYDAV